MKKYKLRRFIKAFPTYWYYWLIWYHSYGCNTLWTLPTLNVILQAIVTVTHKFK